MLTLAQIMSILSLLLAFGVDQQTINTVQVELTPPPPIVATSTPIVVNSMVTPQTTVSPVFGSIAPTTTPVFVPHYSAPQLPSCTLDTYKDSHNTTWVTWTTTNADTAVYFTSGGATHGNQLLYVLPNGYPLSPIATGTQSDLDSEYDKLIVTGQNGTGVCHAIMPGAEPLSPDIIW